MSLEDKCTQTAPNEQQRHQCDLCEKSYKHKSHLTYHVKTTHCRKPIYRFFQCRVCRQGRKKNHLLNEQRSNVFFCNFFLAFETLSEQLLHEYSRHTLHTLGKVTSTENVAASVWWRPWEPASGASSAGEGRRGRKARRRRRRQEAEVESAGHSPGPLKNAT